MNYQTQTKYKSQRQTKTLDKQSNTNSKPLIHEPGTRPHPILAFILHFLFLGLLVQCSPRPVSISELLEKEGSPVSFALNHKRIQDSLSVLGDYESLEDLNLNYNAIESLPEEIGNLKKLKKLSLYGNSIQDLPVGMSELTELETLILGRNPISRVPSSIRNLPNLKTIALDDTKIHLSEEDVNVLASLPNLEILDLSENPEILSAPANIEKLNRVKTILLKKTKLPKDEREKIFNKLPNTELKK